MAADDDPWTGVRAPTLDDFERLAQSAFAGLPRDFRELTDGVSFAVADFPDGSMLDDLGLESEFDLLGLFEGVGLTELGDSPPTGTMPNRIWLFRRPILDYWAEHDERLDAIVTHVLIHEIGHHFGLSDADMEALEAQAAQEEE